MPVPVLPRAKRLLRNPGRYARNADGLTHMGYSLVHSAARRPAELAEKVRQTRKSKWYPDRATSAFGHVDSFRTPQLRAKPVSRKTSNWSLNGKTECCLLMRVLASILIRIHPFQDRHGSCDDC